MPDDRKYRPGMGSRSRTLALVTAALLAGCVNGGGPEASRSATSVSDPAFVGVCRRPAWIARALWNLP